MNLDFGFGEEGLGTALAYFNRAESDSRCNLSLMSADALRAEIATLEKAEAGTMLGKSKEHIDARLRMLEREQARREAGVLKEQSYPILFGMDGDALPLTQVEKLPGEATIADQVTLKGNLKTVYVPAENLADARVQLARIFSEKNDIDILPIEALRTAAADPNTLLFAAEVKVSGALKQGGDPRAFSPTTASEDFAEGDQKFRSRRSPRKATDRCTSLFAPATAATRIRSPRPKWA